MKWNELFSKNKSLIAFIVGVNFFVTLFVVLLVGMLHRGDSTLFNTHQGSRTVSQNIFSSENAVVTAVEQANPAVFSLVVTKDVPVIERYFEESPFGGPFGFPIPRLRENGTQERQIGGGSGFVISQDGLAVTNRHVVEDADASYTALTNDGKQYEVEVIAKDPVLDIAILRLVGGEDLPHLSFSDSTQLKLGQTVIAIGNALGEFQNSVSVGVVSGLSRRLIAGDPFGSSELLEEVIQTDAAINPGNSGGPLLDEAGNVVGMNVAVALGSENIGFALPAQVVQAVVQSVEKHGRIVRPYLGVRYALITPALQEAEDLPVDHGALVSSGETREEVAVLPGSPADRAGIQEGDIILEFNGTEINETHSLSSLIRLRSIGETVTLKVLRGRDERELPVTLAEAPIEQ